MGPQGPQGPEGPAGPQGSPGVLGFYRRETYVVPGYMYGVSYCDAGDFPTGGGYKMPAFSVNPAVIENSYYDSLSGQGWLVILSEQHSAGWVVVVVCADM